MKNLGNIVVRNPTKETGEIVFDYFKSLGVDTAPYSGSNNVENGDKYCYYGVVYGDFGNYSVDKIIDISIKDTITIKAFWEIEKELKNLKDETAKQMDTKINNTVIKATTPETNKKIIEYFKSLGVNVNGFEEEKKSDFTHNNFYYGVIDNIFSFYHIDAINQSNVNIIELPIEKDLPIEDNLPKRGDRILVWDNDGVSVERIYLTFIENSMYPIITVNINYEGRFLNNDPFDISKWISWKPITEETETIVELTLEDISNGKGVGIKPHLIKIKD